MTKPHGHTDKNIDPMREDVVTRKKTRKPRRRKVPPAPKNLAEDKPHAEARARSRPLRRPVGKKCRQLLGKLNALISATKITTIM